MNYLVKNYIDFDELYEIYKVGVQISKFIKPCCECGNPILTGQKEHLLILDDRDRYEEYRDDEDEEEEEEEEDEKHKSQFHTCIDCHIAANRLSSGDRYIGELWKSVETALEEIMTPEELLEKLLPVMGKLTAIGARKVLKMAEECFAPKRLCGSYRYEEEPALHFYGSEKLKLRYQDALRQLYAANTATQWSDNA
jgi:hypothetical protein